MIPSTYSRDLRRRINAMIIEGSDDEHIQIEVTQEFPDEPITPGYIRQARHALRYGGHRGPKHWKGTK